MAKAKKSFLRKQDGFGVMNALVATTVVVVGVMTMMSIHSITLRSKARLDEVYNRTDIENGLRMQISFGPGCRCHFQSRSFVGSPSGLRTGVAISEFHAYNNSCQSQKLLLTTDPSILSSGVTPVSSIALVEGRNLTSDTHAFKLRIEFRDRGTGVIRPLEIPELRVRTRSTFGGRMEITDCGFSI